DGVLYVDGLPGVNGSGSIAGQGGLVDNSLALRFGVEEQTNNPIFYWNGWIDDVRIYNRALSPQEVSALSNNNVGIVLPLRSVPNSPNAATTSIARDECGIIFSIPYIQTGNAITVTASAFNVPNGGGVKFVLNETLSGEVTKYDMSAPFSATF